MHIVCMMCDACACVGVWPACRGYVDSCLTHLACIIAAAVHDVNHMVGGLVG